MICAICLKCGFKRPSPVFRQDLCVSLKQFQYLSQLSWINFIKFLAKQIVKKDAVWQLLYVYTGLILVTNGQQVPFCCLV